MLPVHVFAAAALLTVIILGSLQPDERIQAFGYLLIPRGGHEIDIRPLFGVYSPSIVKTYKYDLILELGLGYLFIWYVVILSLAIVRQRKLPPAPGARRRVLGLSRGVWLFATGVFGLIALRLLGAYGNNADLRPGMEVAAPFAVIAGVSLLNVIRTSPPWNRYKPGYCHVCGYDLRATPDRCPECGTVAVVARASRRVEC
jgi:hypothetical protein